MRNAIKNPANYILTLTNKYFNTPAMFRKTLNNSIFGLTKKSNTTLIQYLKNNNCNNYLNDIISDMINTKITNPDNQPLKNKKDKEMLLLHFTNPLLNHIKISNIINSAEINNLFPVFDNHERYKKPMIIYKYNQPIRA